MKKQLVLCILDGWGCGPPSADNAIYLANTPFLDSLMANYPHCGLEASGRAIGLPDGVAGNSEVGHSIIGSGRVLPTDLIRIDRAINSGELKQCIINYDNIQKNEARTAEQVATKDESYAYHIMGLLSDGSVHAHNAHFEYVVKVLADAGKNVFIHCILDGRDVPPKSTLQYLQSLEHLIKDRDKVKIATISGRFYAMDRDKNWERTKRAYDAVVWGQGQLFSSAVEYINDCYAKNITDEFIPPAISQDYNGIDNKDCLIMTNYRADRARQILQCLLDKNFNADLTAFETRKQFTRAMGFVSYSDDLDKMMGRVLDPVKPQRTLGEELAANGYTQLRISETEKYAHVTFFFNGGTETRCNNEERILIPSPKVTTFDMKPEMSSEEMTDRLCQSLGEFDFIVANYPGADMVGHTGSINSTIQAVEAIDKCLARFVSIALEKDIIVVITADHGNAEKMLDNNEIFTAHALSQVPFIVASKEKLQLHDGSLQDIAPTILALLGFEKPEEMTGTCLATQVKS